MFKACNTLQRFSSQWWKIQMDYRWSVIERFWVNIFSEDIVWLSCAWDKRNHGQLFARFPRSHCEKADFELWSAKFRKRHLRDNGVIKKKPCGVLFFPPKSWTHMFSWVEIWWAGKPIPLIRFSDLVWTQINLTVLVKGERFLYIFVLALLTVFKLRRYFCAPIRLQEDFNQYRMRLVWVCCQATVNQIWSN